MNQIAPASEGSRDCPHALKSAPQAVERGGMRFESGDLAGHATEGGPAVAVEHANDCRRMAVEAVASLTEAPVRLHLVAQNGGQQIFEAIEEFERGHRGRRFVVSVDSQGDRVVVISAGRPM